MCGICLVLNIPIEQHHFSFSFFAPYNPSPEEEILPLNQHIQQHKLTLPQPVIADVMRSLAQRGPSKMAAHLIDMYKTNYHLLAHPHMPEKGFALGVQSTLHLRGFHCYTPDSPGSYFLFNGEVWETGNLPPIDEENGENDGEWLHRTLMACKGSEEKIL
jgi:hypothetical protein